MVSANSLEYCKKRKKVDENHSVFETIVAIGLRKREKD